MSTIGSMLSFFLTLWFNKDETVEKMKKSTSFSETLSSFVKIKEYPYVIDLLMYKFLTLTAFAIYHGAINIILIDIF